jgi:hypothetical protein
MTFREFPEEGKVAKKQMLDDGTERVVEETNDARQGIELHTMRYLVTFGTIGALVILGAIWIVYYIA